MALGLMLVLTLAAEPPSAPTAASAEDSTPVTEEANAAEDPSNADAWGEPVRTVTSTDAEGAIELEKTTVNRPGYGLGMRDVQIKRGPETYNLQARSWNEVVRDDPDLSTYNRRSKMLGGGIAMTAVGGTWLLVSSAVAIDGHYARSAVGGLFQWVAPSIILGGGLIMTLTALSSRRKLRAAQRKIHMAPYATARVGGVTLMGRF